VNPRYLVDGYNLLHKIAELEQLLDSDAERARELLVRRLGDWRAGTRTMVKVVFDGSAGGFVQQQSSGVRAVHCRPGRTADDEIKALVARDPHPRSIVVVTSDNAIVRHVRDFGASTVKSEDFASELAPSVGAKRRDSEAKPEMGPSDVHDWENWFRSIKPDFGVPKPAVTGRGKRVKRAR
jgi:uncharacterized protein